MDSKSFTGGIYFTTFSIAGSSLIACLITRTILEFISTKVFIGIYFFLAALIGCFHVANGRYEIIPEEWGISIAAGLAFVSYSNYTTVLYSQYEFFPTEILGFVMGTANGVARIVAIFTPFFI